MTQHHVESGKLGQSRGGLDVSTGAIWSRAETNDPIADAVANALHWDLSLPRDRIVVRCDSGWVTLSGVVERAYQRSSAEADAMRVHGVRGVTNTITIVAPPLAIAQESKASEARRS